MRRFFECGEDSKQRWATHELCPPPILRRVLEWFLPPGRVRDGLLSDLDELYAERVGRGQLSARLWYAHQLLSAAVHYSPRRLWAMGIHGEGPTMMVRLAKELGQDLRGHVVWHHAAHE